MTRKCWLQNINQLVNAVSWTKEGKMFGRTVEFSFELTSASVGNLQEIVIHIIVQNICLFSFNFTFNGVMMQGRSSLIKCLSSYGDQMLWNHTLVTTSSLRAFSNRVTSIEAKNPTVIWWADVTQFQKLISTCG